MTLRATGAAFLLSIGLALACATAHGHAMLVKCDPGRRAMLTRAPTQVRLWFNERLEPAYSSLSVLDSAGHVVAPGPGAVAKDNAKLMILPLGALKPGIYKVKYRVLSLDGHTVDSSFLFTIKAARK